MVKYTFGGTGKSGREQYYRDLGVERDPSEFLAPPNIRQAQSRDFHAPGGVHHVPCRIAADPAGRMHPSAREPEGC